MQAVICRSRGELLANEKDVKFVLNDSGALASEAQLSTMGKKMK